MSDMHDNQAFAMSSQASPGELLHQEREALGLSLEEAAAGLNLRPAVVRGLENDDYVEVPVAAYRRGYLRAYARLLGIDAAPIIHAYNLRFGETETVQHVAPAQAVRPPSRLLGWLFPIAGMLIALGLAVLLVFWWQDRERAPIATLDANEPVTVDTLDGTTIISGEPPQNEAAPAAPISPPDTATSRAGIAATAPDDESAAVSNDGRAATNSDEGAGAAESQGATSTPEAPSETTPPAAQDNRALAFTFNKESWTEVVDATGTRILIGLQSPDTQAKVEGEPPFRLTVGNANGVELRYRGEAVDLARIAGAGNVARFTLGE
ncbi:RodZ domain-containing protein [Pistricoccus aurantiacus]|uniref:RodZ domain-containing protein n=1 Tax=Pistricoccus aurantiacus TaxID=1883414 RepID=UPI003626F802